MVTKEQAVWAGIIGYGEFHHGKCTRTVGPRGRVIEHVERWGVNGRCKTWKTWPEEFKLPIKYGMYRYGYITDRNASEFHIIDECPLRKEEEY